MNPQKIQQNFASHIFKKSDQKILQEIPYSKQEALARLNIYRNNVLGGFESALSSTFSITKKIAGAEKFAELVQKYCQKFPSKSGNLNDFGQDFPKFLSRYKPLYLKDLSQLELLHHQDYLAEKYEVNFDLEKFKNLPIEKFTQLTFELNPSSILFSSKFAVFSIWKKEKEIKNFLKPECVMAFSNQIFLLTAEEFLFLSLIQKQKNLYQIYKMICKKMKKEVDVGKLINRFISTGVIVSFKLN